MQITRKCIDLIKVLTKHNTEVAVMCITPNSPTLIEEIHIPKQFSTASTFEIEEDGYAEAAQELFDQGYEYHMFSRILLHTHPGNSAIPSGQDWETFNELYSNKIFSSMIIVAKDFSSTCHVNVYLKEIDKKFTFSEKLEIYDPILEGDKAELVNELSVKIQSRVPVYNHKSNGLYMQSNPTSKGLFEDGYYFDDFYGGIYARGECEVDREVLDFYTGGIHNFTSKEADKLAAKIGLILRKSGTKTVSSALLRVMEDSPVAEQAILNLARYLILLGEVETVMTSDTMKETLGESNGKKSKPELPVQPTVK